MKKLASLILVFISLHKVAVGQVVDLVSGLVVNYSFNGNANNSARNNFHGVIHGNVTPTTDRFDKPNSAYLFGGTNADYIQVPHHDSLNFSQDFSISVWAYRSTPEPANAMLISKGIAEGGDGYNIRVNADDSSKAAFRLGNGIYWTYSKEEARSPRDLALNTWTHYLGVYVNGGRTMLFYEDGLLVGYKYTLYNYSQSDTLPLIIGQQSVTTRPSSILFPFKGKIDDIKIYNRALSDCEAYALANDIDTCYMIYDNLKAQYDYCGYPNDISGNGNQGTLSGASLVKDRYERIYSANSFSGINSGMDISEISSFNFDTTSFTLATWFRTTSSGVQRIMGKGDLNWSNGYLLGINVDAPGSLSFGIGVNGNIAQSTRISTQTTFADGLWHYAVATANHDNKKMSIFVDGRQQPLNKTAGTAGTITGSGAELLTEGLSLSASSPENFTVAKYSDNTQNYIGSLDDIRVYNRPLYKADVRYLFELPSPGGYCCPFVPLPGVQNYSVCGNGSLALSATGGVAGYEWYTKSVGGVLLVTTSSLNVSNITRDSVFYVVSLLTSNCKSGRAQIRVVVTIPSAPIIPDQAICGPGSITLSATGTGLVKWYNTSVGGALLGSGPTLFIPLLTATGKYFGSNTQDGCESIRDSVKAFVRPVPTIAGINGPASVCPTVTNVGYGVNSLPGYTYQWSVTGGAFAGTQVGDTVIVNWGPATANANIKMQPTNQYACKGDIYAKTITINSVLGIGSVPIGDSIICTASSKGRLYYLPPSSGASYSWTVIHGTQTTPDNYFVYVNATVPGLMKLTVFETVTTSSNVVCKGQSDTLRVMTYFSPDSTLSIQAAPRVCQAGSPVFSLNGFSNSTYQWSITKGTIVSGQGSPSVTANLSATGEFLLKAQETSNKGCVGRQYVSTITADTPFLTKIVIGQDTVCTRFGINQLYSVTGFDGSSYEWTSDNVNWTPIPGLTIAGNAFLLTSPGTGFIKVREIPLFTNICPNKDSLFVRVLQSPVNLSVTGRTRFCENTLNEPYSIAGFQGSTFSWWVQSTIIKSGKGTDHVNIDFKIPGSYKITVLEKAENGCLGDSIQSRLFIQVDPKPKARIIVGDSIPCAAALDSIPYYLNGYLASAYHWDVLGDHIEIVSGQGTGTVKIKLDSNYWRSRYWVKVVETSGEGCTGDTVKKFIRIDRPEADIKSVSVSESNEQTIELNSAPAGHFASFVRVPGSTFKIPFQTTQSLDNKLRPDSIIYNYQLIEKDKCGKVYSSTFQQNIFLKGKTDSTYGSARLNWNPYIGWLEGVKEYQVWRSIGEGGVAEQIGTVNPDSVRGNFVTGADGPVQIFRIKAIGNDQTRVAVSNPVKLLFDDVPKVYSGFSPNGDGRNDTWVVDRLNLYPQNKVTIMDKWGTPVFEKDNYFGEWDGTSHGKNVPDGIYYYVIELGSGRKPLTGTVSVIR